MKKIIPTAIMSILVFTSNTNANESKSIYVNKHVGFNVEGYKFKQPELPCNVDVSLIEQIVKKGNREGLSVKAVGTKEEIKNGTVPVILIDIEQLSLRHSKSYGDSNNFNLPTIQINAGILQGESLQTAKHTCAMTETDKFTMPTDKILLNHTQIQICAEAQKCVEDLSKDVIEWVKPQLK